MANPFFHLLNPDIRTVIYGFLDVGVERHGLKGSCRQAFKELRDEEKHRVQKRISTINRNGGLFGSKLDMYMFDNKPYVNTFIELSVNTRDLSNLENTTKPSELSSSVQDDVDKKALGLLFGIKADIIRLHIHAENNTRQKNPARGLLRKIINSMPRDVPVQCNQFQVAWTRFSVHVHDNGLDEMGELCGTYDSKHNVQIFSSRSGLRGCMKIRQKPGQMYNQCMWIYIDNAVRIADKLKSTSRKDKRYLMELKKGMVLMK